MLSMLKPTPSFMIKCSRNAGKKSIIPILTDVTLRDGLQTEIATNWPLSRKQDLFHEILLNYSPHNIEVGSFANPKVLPIMNDTKPLLEYARQYIHTRQTIDWNPPNIYALVPVENKLQEAIDNGVTNYGFITSVSNAFQMKNIRKTIVETKEGLKNMSDVLNSLSWESKTLYRKKLYISCITECPLAGPIDIDQVLHEICHYHHKYTFDELCLSDTCGSLTFDDYEYLIQSLRTFGVPSSKIGLHLHIHPQNKSNIRQIIEYSLRNNIVRFDVSAMEIGGCSVTMDPSHTVPNLTYSAFYDMLHSIEN